MMDFEKTKKTMLKIALCLVMAALSFAGCGNAGSGADFFISDKSSEEAIRESELWYQNGDDLIYGKLYLPEQEQDNYPTVILSHGFGVTHSVNEKYARYFAANGYAAYAFDFRGGGRESQSDGEMTDMSVLTEASDLNAVLDSIKEEDFVQADNIALFGESQGGFVSAYVAGKRPDDVKNLILLYPAFVLQEQALERDHDPDTMPETEKLLGSTVGKIYTLDAVSFDIWDVIKDYPKDVLIIHGDKDRLVPLEYSHKALNVFPSASLEIIEGAGHGFDGYKAKQAENMALVFLNDH